MKQLPESTDEHAFFLMEQHNHELKIIFKAITSLQESNARIEKNMATKEDIKRLERHLSLHDYILNKHEERLDKLETAS